MSTLVGSNNESVKSEMALRRLCAMASHAFLLSGLTVLAPLNTFGEDNRTEIGSPRNEAVPYEQSLELTELSSVHADLAYPASLDARQVGCAAACRWNAAAGLRQRARTIQQLNCDQSQATRRAAAILVCFLHLQAAYQEDIGAATAMRAYYGRIGNGEQETWIDAGVQAVGLQRQSQLSLIDHGLATGFDLSSLDRKQLDLRDLRLQSESQERQLRELLTSLTGIEFELTNWVVEPLSIHITELDCDSLIAQALRDRYDLQAWRYLCCHIDEDTAPMMVPVLASLSGGFGLPLPSLSILKRLLCHADGGAVLAESLRRELSVLVRTHEDWIRQSVHEKCLQLRLAYQRHQIEVERVASWQERLDQLQRLGFHGQEKPEDVAAAESGLLEARSSEVTRRLEAKLAEVSLAEAVGGLAVRCCRGEAWLPTGN